MSDSRTTSICPAELSGTLDNPFRKFFQNPEKILRPRIEKGMTVMDLGCGPGFFSVVAAKIVTDSGKVISVDLQEKMLEKLTTKIKGTGLGKIISLHKCEVDKVGVTEKVDFILAFWMIHEVPEKLKLFTELKSILKPGGKLFIAEPKIHVSKSDFTEMMNLLMKAGYKVLDTPKVSISRAVLVTVAED